MDRLLRARVLVAEAAELGLSVDDLVAASPDVPSTRSVPTVREYRQQIESTFSPGTLRTYRSYWLLAERIYGDKPVDMVTSDDVDEVLVAAAERARARRPGTDARSPRENCVAAQRAFFERARRAKYILENPAAEVPKPRRHPSSRRGLDEHELAEATEALRSTSRDLELDMLLFEFHLVSGARQEGALRLALDDLDDRRSTAWLLEKFGKRREQPVPPSLIPRLRAHARRRGATKGTDRVFRTKRGVPISRRRYDTVFGHVQAVLPWTVRTPVTAHVLRHTGATAVERLCGLAVAETWLGNEPPTVAATYTKARLEEVAAAVQMLSGEPHPLAVVTGRAFHVA